SFIVMFPYLLPYPLHFILHPFPTRRSSDLLDYILTDSEARVLVAHPASAEAGKAAAAQHDVEFRTLPVVGDEGPRAEVGAEADAAVDRAERAGDDVVALLHTPRPPGQAKGDTATQR